MRARLSVRDGQIDASSLAWRESGVAGCATAIRVGLRTSRQTVESALQRYSATEPDVCAFTWLDADRALRLADARDRHPSIQPLHGVPIGVKDIFDTRGIPTRLGSLLFERRVPARSAEVVLRLERAGAIVLGKTVTTEFAFLAPGPTRNPHDVTRSPGGSSQGSAAAVAAGVVPGAIGSQTNGSTIRPAAFCGVVGFKPTAGRIPRRGVMSFSHTLDQVGVFGRSVDDVRLLAAVLAGDSPGAWYSEPPTSPRLAIVPTGDWSVASSAMQHRFLADVESLTARGARVASPPLPDGIDDASDLVGRVMAFESLRTIGRRVPRNSPDISWQTRDLWARGSAISERDHLRILRRRRQLIASFDLWLSPFDAILTLPAPGEAPDASSTGDPRFCSRWTLVGAPALVLPTGYGPNGLPIGLQLVGHRGDDAGLLGVGRWAESVLKPVYVRPDGPNAEGCDSPVDRGP